jgi:hypothetical protein
VRNYRERRRGKLRGFADVVLVSIGLEIANVPIFIGRNGPFAGMPSRPVIGGDGIQKTDVNGRRSFEPVVTWSSWARSDAFSRAVVEAVRKLDPGALDADDLARQPAAARQERLDFGDG